MKENAPPSTIFGLPLVLKRVDAEQLVNELSQLWKWQMRRKLHTLEEDLDELHRFFDPVATGKRLRALLSELPPPPIVSARLLHEPLVLNEGNMYLVTLEGRAAITLLQMQLSSTKDNSIMIEIDIIYPIEHKVYERYRQWNLHRITDVLRLQSGKAQSLRLPSIGLLLLLLVNGSRSPQTAMRSLLDEREDYLDQVVRTIVASFCDALDEREHDTRHYVLYSGYPLTEARRRLPSALPIDPAGTYISPMEEEKVLRFIVAELRRPQRSFPKIKVLAAYDQLITAYRRELPKLAALNMAFEKRLETLRIRQRLENLLDNDNTCA